MTAAGALVGLLLVGAPVGKGQAQPPAVFGVQVENVYVDAFVTNRGEPVLGLTAANFELKDNGVVQRLDMVSAESLPLLAVLAFDTSNSLAGEGLAALKAASLSFLESLRPQDEVALFTFAGEVQWRTRPTTDRTAMRRAIEEIKTSDGTSIVDALFAAVTLPQSRARTLVVLFTDGEDNSSWLDWGQIQGVAERSNALIHVVGLRPRRTDPASADSGPASASNLGGRMAQPSGAPLELEHTFSLRKIAEVTGGRYWEAESTARLKSAFSAIAEAMGHRYVLRYDPQDVERPGWHQIKLRLRGAKGAVHARSGYWVKGF